MNCGRNAVKNSSPFGLVSADSAPWRNSERPARGSAGAWSAMPIGGARQTWMPSQTR